MAARPVGPRVSAVFKASYITYGLYNYGNKRNRPLREFRVRNGFEEILAPTYFVPLTLWGRLCMKAKLNRGLVGILPHSVITVGLGARALWYNFTAFLSRCSSTTERPNRNRLMEFQILPWFQFLEVRSKLLSELLRYAPGLSMAHGLELLVPFVDKEIVECVERLPANFKVRNGA